MRKRLFVGFLTVFAVFAALLFIPSLFKEQVSDILKAEINDRLHADVSFDEADINLWRSFPRFTFTLDNFVVAGKDEFKGDTLVRTRELHIVISSYRLLFFNEIEVTDLTLTEPEIHLLIHKNQLANFDILNAADTTAGDEHEVKLGFESMSVEHANFFYDDRASGIQVSGEDVTLHGSGEMKGNVLALSLDASTKGFSTSYDQQSVISDKSVALNMKMSYDFNTGLLQIPENSLQVNHLALNLTGSYRNKGDDHFVDVQFASADSEFKDLLSLSNTLFADFRKMKVDGHFHLDGFVKGVYNSARGISPSFHVNMKVAEGMVKYDHLPSSLNNIQFHLLAENRDSLFQNTVFDVKTFSINIGNNPFTGSMVIRGLRDCYIKSDIVASINLKDLALIYPMDSVSMSGQLDFELRAEGKYDGAVKQFATLASAAELAVPSFSLALNLTDGTFKYDHLPQAIEGVNFHMRAKNTRGVLDNTSMSIERLEAKLGGHPVRGFVHVDGIRNPRINSELKASLDFADLGKFLPLDALKLQGLFELEMKVSGEMNDSLKRAPMIDANLNLANGYVESPGYPAPIEKTHLVIEAINQSGKLKDTRLNIDTLTYTIGDESFFVKGVISDLEKYNYDLQMKGIIYLDKLVKILGLDNVAMGGEIDVDLQTAGNYPDLVARRYHKLPTDGQVLMKNVAFRSESVPHGLKITQGHLYFTNEKIMLDTLHGLLGESAFNITGHLYNYMAYIFAREEKIRGDLLFESDYFNINELLRSEKTTRNDTAHHHVEAFELPANIEFTFDTDITNLVYKNLNVNNLQGELQLKDGVLLMRNTTFETLDADFMLSGSYDTRDKAHPAFDVKLKIQELDINKAHNALVTVQAIAPAAEDTYGVFSVDYALKGELLPNLYPVFTSVSGGGTIRIREAKINGMKVFKHISGMTKKEELLNPDLKDIVMETSVQRGVFYVKPFSMKLAG
ncbi:MAG TPA: hypothetical protein VEB86_13915, partial [Chryseosolibacter sp.]|nr:hypothetical protein [Chryseosolibacter sp.]